MIFRIFQYIGIFIIITFSGISILFSSSEDDFKIQGQQKSNFFTYASFFENRFFDLRMKFTLDKNKKDKRMVIAAIDDHSLNKLGRWPWTRTKHAELVDKLGSFGAKILAFDVFYSEPESACNAISPDIVFSDSIKKFQSIPGRKVILPYSIDDKETNKIDEENHFKEMPDQLLNFTLISKQTVGANLQPKLVGKKIFPIPRLADLDIGLSHLGENTDSDGVFRNYTLIANIDSIYLPSFALQIYQLYSNDNVVVEIPSPELGSLVTKSGRAFLNYDGATKIRWFGGLDHFPLVSIYDIFKAKDGDPGLTEIFKDKIVFIASTAFGAHDLRNTPVDSQLPGVVTHMNMVHMLLEGDFLVSEVKSTQYSWFLMTLGSLIIICTMLFGNAILDFFVVNFIILTFLILDIYYFIPHGYNLKLFFCIFSVAICYSWSTFLHFYQSNKEKKKIKGTFSRYLAPSIVNELLKNPEKVRLGGEKKNITVFFSDVRDFTSISEKLSPEQLTLCLNKYMTMMTDTLFENKGTLDKYIGDAMVAYWGAPVDLENHPYWAVKGAIAMIERLPDINAEFERDGFPTFKHGIGLNTGECSVGNMGSNQIFSYTALGDNMNLGARLESLCKYYGVQLNVSEYTKNAIAPELAKEFVFRTLDKVKVKGKENALTIYEVLHPSHPLYNDKEALELYENSFLNYLNLNFLEASIILQNLSVKYPDDKTFARMLQTCLEFIAVPPPTGWDGTYTHITK